MSALNLLRLYHDAASNCDGVMMLVPIFGENRVRPQRIAIGDAKSMAQTAVELSETANVYFAAAVVRKDIPANARGKKGDMQSVLGLVFDDDADTGKRAVLPSIEPTAIVRTSAVRPKTGRSTTSYRGPCRRTRHRCSPILRSASAAVTAA